MRELQTPRLLIRAFRADDLADFTALMRSCFGPAPDDSAIRTRLDFFALGDAVLDDLCQPPYGDRAVVLRSGGRLIGSVGLVPCLAPFGQLPGFGGQADAPFTPEVGLFWAIAPGHRGNGYATEASAAMIDFAFAGLGIGRIVAATERDNAASIAVMRRLGMTIESNPGPAPQWFQTVGVMHSSREILPNLPGRDTEFTG